MPTVSGTAANPIKFVGTFSGNQAIATLLPQPTTTKAWVSRSNHLARPSITFK